MGVKVEVELRGRALGTRCFGSTVLVGSARSADLVLPHPTVALHHLRMEVRRGRLVIVDLGQAPRGTVVAGRRILAPVVAPEGRVSLSVGEVGLVAHLTQHRRPAGTERVRLDRLLELEASGRLGFPPEVRVGLAARLVDALPPAGLSPAQVWLGVSDGAVFCVPDADREAPALGLRPLLAALSLRGLEGFEDLELGRVGSAELLRRAGEVGLDPGTLAVVRVLRVAHVLLGAGA